MAQTSAHKGFDLFTSIKKGRIGLPKSPALVEAIQSMALNDTSCREFFELFSTAATLTKEAQQKKASRQDIIFFLRGCKCTLFEFLKTFRKLIFAISGPKEVKAFDRLSQHHSLVEPTEHNLLNVELKRMALHTQQLLDKDIEFKILLPLLKEFIKASRSDDTSVNFVTGIDMFFISDNPPRPSEPPPEAEDDAALALLSSSERKALLRHHRKTPEAGSWGLGLSVMALQADAERKGASMRTMTAKAEKLYGKLAENGCIQDMSMFLDGSPPKSGKNCRQLESDYKKLIQNVESFFRGVDATASVLRGNFATALETHMACSKNKANDTLRKTIDVLALKGFINSLLLDQADKILRTRMQAFLFDMRNEGIVSDLQDTWSKEVIAPNRLEVRCLIPLRRGHQGLRGISSIIRDHPDMLLAVSHCPSLSEPLAESLKEGMGQNKNEVARAMARLIHFDFSMKNFLVQSPALRKLVVENCSKPNFFEVMKGFCTASLQIKKAALGNPSLLRVVLAADGARPGLGIARTLFATPAELKALAQVLKNKDQTHAFLTRLIHRLSEN